MPASLESTGSRTSLAVHNLIPQYISESHALGGLTHILQIEILDSF